MSSYTKIALIGCGYWGKNILRNLHELDAIACLCDTNFELAEKFATEYGLRAVSFQEILESSTVENVAFATPAAEHYQQVRQAITAGKNVFVEKPLALNAKQGEELCGLAERDGKVLMVGHLLQYHSGFIKLKELVNNGELGRIQYIYSHRLNLGKVRRAENILWSFAPHDISMILALVNAEPESISAMGSNYLHKNIADVTTTHLTFPGGENAHVFVSWLHPFKEQKLIVVGDKSMVVFDDMQPWSEKLVKYPHRIDWKDGMPIPVKADGIAIDLEESEPLKNELQHYIDCIDGNSVCKTDGREGLRVLRVLNAAEASMKNRRSINISREDDKPELHDAGIHETAVIDDGCQIGFGTRIWHFSHVLSGSRIGSQCSIGQNVMIGPDVSIGERCKIQNNVSIYKGVTLADDVFCGPSCVFTNVNTPRADINRKDEFQPTFVNRGATIGANATIVCGNTIGEYAFIAAGAVVTRDVPAFALMAGVPARRIAWVSHAGEKLGPDMVCPRSGRRYIEKAENVLEELL